MWTRASPTTMKAAPQHHAKDRISPNKTFPKSACKIYYRLHSAKFASAIVTSLNKCFVFLKYILWKSDLKMHWLRWLQWKSGTSAEISRIKSTSRHCTEISKRRIPPLHTTQSGKKNENFNSLSLGVVLFFCGGGCRRLQTVSICKKEMEA